MAMINNPLRCFPMCIGLAYWSFAAHFASHCCLNVVISIILIFNLIDIVGFRRNPRQRKLLFCASSIFFSSLSNIFLQSSSDAWTLIQRLPSTLAWVATSNKFCFQPPKLEKVLLSRYTSQIYYHRRWEHRPQTCKACWKPEFKLVRCLVGKDWEECLSLPWCRDLQCLQRKRQLRRDPWWSMMIHEHYQLIWNV